MATLDGNKLTLGDVVRRSNPDGTIAIITESMDQFTGVSNDCPWFEGELPGGHQGTYRASLPAWNTVNPNGTNTTAKSTTGQNLESVEYLQSLMEIHDLVGRYGGSGVAGKQASETPAFISGGMQTVSLRLIYGNGSATAGQINGINIRYNSLTTGNNARNCVDGGAAGGQTDCMSVLFFDWGQGKVSGFYPQGSKGGFEMINHGRRVKDVTSTTQQVVHTIEFLQGIGLAVDNWTSVVRVANIDKSLLVAGTGADLFDKFIQAKHKLSRGVYSKTRAMYMNSTTRMMLDIQGRNDVISGGGLKFENVGGVMMDTWQGIPLNVDDQLTESETVVS